MIIIKSVILFKTQKPRLLRGFSFYIVIFYFIQLYKYYFFTRFFGIVYRIKRTARFTP